MVDPERLHRLLRRVSDDLAVLRTYAEVDAGELAEDPVRLGHVKYLFVTMRYATVDTAGWWPTCSTSTRSTCSPSGCRGCSEGCPA